MMGGVSSHQPNFRQQEARAMNDPAPPVTPPASAADRLDMALGEAIYSLRAIRRHRPDPIPDEDINSILDAAIQAPNGANMQLWHFLVVSDEAHRADFAGLYKEAWWAKRHESGWFEPEDLPDVYRAPMRLADEIGKSPVLILVCTTVRGLEAANSIIPSVQNLLLAARCLGIGGTITTLHPSVEPRVHALFGIPDTAQVVYCVPLGYPQGNFGPVTRQPLDEVSSYNTWAR